MNCSYAQQASADSPAGCRRRSVRNLLQSGLFVAELDDFAFNNRRQHCDNQCGGMFAGLQTGQAWSHRFVANLHPMTHLSNIKVNGTLLCLGYDVNISAFGGHGQAIVVR